MSEHPGKLTYPPVPTIAELVALLGGSFAPIPVSTAITSSATPTPAVGASGARILYIITALAVAAELQTPTGTPQDGQELIYRIKDDGTARALTYSAGYRAGTEEALPTTTVISETMYLGFRYNAADAVYDYIGGRGGF